MVRIFAPPPSLAGDRATLDEAAYRHLIKVLRLGVGDTLKIFDGRGMEIDARIESVGKNSVDCSLGNRRELPTRPTTLTLLQSPPKNERMEYIVQKTTELGVNRIIPILTRRGVLVPSQDRCARWQTIAMEAARQCGRADIPKVEQACTLVNSFTLLDAQTLRLMLWEEERDVPILRPLAARPKNVTLMVGPEGGFEQEEVALCQQAGFLTTRLGPLILRADTAAIVAVALTQSAGGALE